MIKLKEMPNTVVHCETKEEFKELMEIYEAGGWDWRNGYKPTIIIDKIWEWNKSETCVDVKDKIGHGSLKYHKESDYNIISLAEFKQEQGIQSYHVGGETRFFQDNQPKFKVGDKVICYPWGAAPDKIGYIDLVDKFHNYYRVEGYWYRQQDLEPYEEEKDWTEDHVFTVPETAYYEFYSSDGGWWIEKRRIDEMEQLTNLQNNSPEDYTKGTIIKEGMHEHFMEELFTNSQNKGGVLKMLKEIPDRLKRMLNKKWRACYRLGWIDGELDLTTTGTETMINYFFDKEMGEDVSETFGDYAVKVLKEREEEEKK